MRLRRSMVASGIALACISALGVRVEAVATVNVLVTNFANRAGLDGVTVCIGTSSNRALHGRRTTANGRATFENVPEGSWIVTAWRTTYATGQTTINVTSTTTSLTPGIVLTQTAAPGTDPCAGSTTTPQPEVRYDATPTLVVNAPTITSFSINNSETMDVNDPVYLVVRYSGPAPTEFRVSELSDQFSDTAAVWRPYNQLPGFGGHVRYPSPTFATPARTKRVYLQLRTGTRVSNVASDTIQMEQTAAPSGMDAVAVARRQGFSFSATPPCIIEFDGYGSNQNTFLIQLVQGDLSALTRGPATCVNTVFGGRSLAPGWRFTALRWRIVNTSNNCRITASPQTPATRLHTQLFVSGNQCDFVLTTVELRGPAGASWQDAFDR